MGKVRQKGTGAELRIRKMLHAAGLRYRLHVALITKPRRVADIVFPRARVAVFIDGCFWHGCPIHASWPKNNAEYWRSKIETNRARDADTDQRLGEAGWEVIRVWEHENPSEASMRIAKRIAARKASRK
ncbi:very short patch repair endonuclease [Ciceribacter selenitireducens]|uniref:very short patch repair endonuclease n=1 Tax=Ciceribacter selenitireducens TaxID=448181 RepID=UPI000E20C45D|nr:very short patch repair endonuclease [Ciceribacter selenitireducens]